MTVQEVFLTAEGRRKLEEELELLTTVRRVEVAGAIREAKMDGDVMENAGYEEAKRQQAFLEGRIRTVEGLLKSAVLIDPSRSSEEVALGSLVTVQEAGFGPESYTIVGSAEANPGQGRISNESPLGRALMGHKKGDRVTFQSPGGLVEVTILRLE
jgi:transcription elongation factor GreA